MAYLRLEDYDSEEAIIDLLSRKEFFVLKIRDEPKRPVSGKTIEQIALEQEYERHKKEMDVYTGHYLKLYSYQLFVRNFMNPHTPYKRLHLFHSVGAGKTTEALAVAFEFIRVYKSIYESLEKSLPDMPARQQKSLLDNATPSVFVLGFGGTRAAFTRDLLKYTEFGILNEREYEDLIHRRHLANTGIADNEKHYNELMNKLRRRFSDKTRNGFFKFYGYDEFSNKLFSSTEPLSKLDAEIQSRIKAGEDIDLETVINERIASGSIKVNKVLLKQFENSLIIADEIHNTYNTNFKNSRGIALQYILNTIPSVRLLSLSATMINNSPSEVIDFMNYLLPPDKKLIKSQWFVGNDPKHDNVIKELGDMSKGFISFLQDTNLKYYPHNEFVGEELEVISTITKRPAKIPYLKFIPCPMSEFQQKTLNYFYDNIAEGEKDEEEPYTYHRIPVDSYSLFDMVYPNPKSNDYGLFQSSQLFSAVSIAEQQWRSRVGIAITKYQDSVDMFSGEFLRAENIGRYSSKFAKLWKIVEEKLHEGNQKIMIYHERVKTSGGLVIQEILRMNGILDEFSEPVDNTLCSRCGRARKDHFAISRASTANNKDKSKANESLDKSGGKNDKITHHEFNPARFITVNSKVSQQRMTALFSVFNDPINDRGDKFCILIGSKIIKESYDFKSIRTLILASIPVNIPTAIQVIGRVVRKNSHITLPEHQRNVKIYILLTTSNPAYRSGPAAMRDKTSPELYKYRDKMHDYLIIQRLQREFSRNAVDSAININISHSPELMKRYFPGVEDFSDKKQLKKLEPRDILGTLYFDPAVSIPDQPTNDISFTAYGQAIREVKYIFSVIKRLFSLRKVWEYDTLLEAVRYDFYNSQTNPDYFSEDAFVFALNNFNIDINIVDLSEPAGISKALLSTRRAINKINDFNDNEIYINDIPHKLSFIDKYIIAFPVLVSRENTVLNSYISSSNIRRDKEADLINKTRLFDHQKIADVETYMRYGEHPVNTVISVSEYLHNYKNQENYQIELSIFQEQITEWVVRLSDFHIKSYYYADMLFIHSQIFQRRFVEEAIIWAYKSRTPIDRDIKKLLKTAQDALLNKPQSLVPWETIYMMILVLLDDLKLLIYMPEVIALPDIIKLYDDVPDKPSNIPVGYERNEFIWVYIAGKKKSELLNKMIFKRDIKYIDNPIIVGFLDTVSMEITKFKLRRPNPDTDIEDKRFLEKGIVCETKKKSELIEIVKELKIKLPRPSKTRQLCKLIKDTIIEREFEERRKGSKVKWFYTLL